MLNVKHGAGMRQPFETLDESTLLDVWSTELKMSARRHATDDEDDEDDTYKKLKDIKCGSDVALDKILDDTMRNILAAFWHKGRKGYVEWTVDELASRSKITKHRLGPILTRMGTLGAIKFRLNRGNRFSTDRAIEVVRLTDIAVSVATADRDARTTIGGAMTPLQLRSIRQAIGIQCKHMAERLQIDGTELMQMECGKKPITQAMADAVIREQKKHFSRMYSK
jgi:DNA-binding MarR family transcriptional regulator